MEKLPKDVLMMLALDLNLPDIVRLCRTSSRIDKDVCENSYFWRQKISKDFPTAKYQSKDTRQIYLNLDKMLTKYPELKDILPLIIVDKFKFSKILDDRPVNLLNSLDEKVRIKMMNDYNKHEIYSRTRKVSESSGTEILSFIEKAGMYYGEEYENYYMDLIEQLKEYLKNPNMTFDASKWEFRN